MGSSCNCFTSEKRQPSLPALAGAMSVKESGPLGQLLCLYLQYLFGLLCCRDPPPPAPRAFQKRTATAYHWELQTVSRGTGWKVHKKVVKDGESLRSALYKKQMCCAVRLQLPDDTFKLLAGSRRQRGRSPLSVPAARRLTRRRPCPTAVGAPARVHLPDRQESHWRGAHESHQSLPLLPERRGERVVRPPLCSVM